MLWKIYLWVYLLIVLFGTFSAFSGGIMITNLVIFGTLTSLLGVLAVFSYAYKKKLFRHQIFWVVVMILQALSIYDVYISDKSTSFVDKIISFLIEAPAFYAIIMLVFKPLQNTPQEQQ
jgi:hypothetical protein